MPKLYDPAANPRSARPQTVELTAQQKRQWDETRTGVLWSSPFFAHILYTLMVPKGHNDIAYFTEDPAIPVAATDGLNLLLKPSTFFKYDLKERIFIVLHEISHCIFDHCGLMHAYAKRKEIGYKDGVKIPYSPEAMNIATDLVINAMLIEANLGKFNKDWLHDPQMATGEDSAIDTYRKLFDSGKVRFVKMPSPGGKGGQGQGDGDQQVDASGVKGEHFDEHMQPGGANGKDPDQTAQDRTNDKAEWDTQVAAGMAAAKAQGKLPASLERVFGELLDPKVDWRDKIRGIFQRKVGSDSYDWRKLDRRLIVRNIGAPGRSGFGAGDVVVAADTSGSIGAKELDMFFAELSGILEDVRPRRVFLIWCDAKVQRVDELADLGDLNWVRHKGAPGGGGTSFVPVFDWVAENSIEPDALVYLTDGLGSFPTEPEYPVIWGNIYKGMEGKFPFGDEVLIAD